MDVIDKLGEQKKRNVEIEKFASINKTEMGETQMLLLSLWNRQKFLSKEMAEALNKELDDILETYQKDYEITEKTVTRLSVYKSLIRKK